MASADLIARLPVNEKDAQANRWGKLPWPPLVKHLKGENNSDSPRRTLVKMDEFPTQKPKGMSDADWRKFKKHYEEDRFYMQSTVTNQEEPA